MAKQKGADRHYYYATAGKVGLVLMAVFLAIYMITIVSGSSDFFDDSAQRNAILTFEEDVERAEMVANQHYENLYEIVDRLVYAKSPELVEDILESYIGSEQFGNLRYYSQGVSYDVYGAEVVQETSGAEYISALAQGRQKGCTPVYTDKATELDCIAFFVPVRGSLYIDGLLSIVPARNIVSVGSVINDKAEAVWIMDESGKVFADKTAEDFRESIGNNAYRFLDSFTHNKNEAETLSEAIAKNEKTAFAITANGIRYTVAVSPLSTFDNHLSLVSLSVSDGLIAPEVTYIRHIVNLLVIAICALIIGFIYAVLYHRKSQEALQEAILFDAKLDCPNQEQFRRVCSSLIYSRRRKYSVAVLAIRNFVYLRDQLGENDSTEFLKTLAKIIQTLSNDEECYGYAGDGKFLALMINANSHSIGDKIRLIETLINREKILSDRGMKIRFAAGVYNVMPGLRRTIQGMIDCANAASGYAEDTVSSTYTLFTDEVSASIAHNEKIEAMMEGALANGDFRLFLQPKYDAHHDVIGSAEALVRWFDTTKGDYMFPADFIPLFESNGFIAKLDHFVYIEVLEYLSRAVERGEKVIPIAVNVSRVTANSEDFISFYVGNKKKYNIPDGFITLELTESFAMEDYDKIAGIISALHNSGMRCSIDDFGSGYSSFSILKQIRVDELKLDSVFIKRGTDVKRDDKLLSTIIDLAKSMDMEVVQEGVETKEQFDKVIEMGCDTIQGFYYAKAMPLEEFKIFINTNTSIKYKALVK